VSKLRLVREVTARAALRLLEERAALEAALHEARLEVLLLRNELEDARRRLRHQEILRP